jgi:integrase
LSNPSLTGFVLQSPAVAASIHYYESHPRLSRGWDKTDISLLTNPFLTNFLPSPFHSLRHTYAYILKSQGIHVTTAQKLMGHSDPKITMAIYTRVLDNEIDNAGAILRRMSG